MYYNLLFQIRDMSHLLQNCDSQHMAIGKILSKLEEVSASNISFVGKTGEILYERSVMQSHQALELEKKRFIDAQLNDQFGNILETKENVRLGQYYTKSLGDYDFTNHTGVISPVAAFGKRLGTLVLYKENSEFDENTLILTEQAAALIAVIIWHNKEEQEQIEAKKIQSVKSAISTLSYSELEAVLYVFNELEGGEGLLIASRVADRVGITRSVIVNALRKFEIAGIIESRSLGMKGTYIKVLNEYLLEDLNKLHRR